MRYALRTVVYCALLSYLVFSFNPSPIKKLNSMIDLMEESCSFERYITSIDLLLLAIAEKHMLRFLRCKVTEPTVI